MSKRKKRRLKTKASNPNRKLGAVWICPKRTKSGLIQFFVFQTVYYFSKDFPNSKPGISELTISHRHYTFLSAYKALHKHAENQRVLFGNA